MCKLDSQGDQRVQRVQRDGHIRNTKVEKSMQYFNQLRNVFFQKDHNLSFTSFCVLETFGEMCKLDSQGDQRVQRVQRDGHIRNTKVEKSMQYFNQLRNVFFQKDHNLSFTSFCVLETFGEMCKHRRAFARLSSRRKAIGATPYI